MQIHLVRSNKVNNTNPGAKQTNILPRQNFNEVCFSILYHSESDASDQNQRF